MQIIKLTALIFLASCSLNQENQGRVTFHNTANKNSFSFVIDDEFTQKNKNSPADKQNPKLTKAESDLLSGILKKRSYCINNEKNASFVITSKQEKIYDITFASVIEESYNAKPAVPTTYFGECR